MMFSLDINKKAAIFKTYEKEEMYPKHKKQLPNEFEKLLLFTLG